MAANTVNGPADGDLQIPDIDFGSIITDEQIYAIEKEHKEDTWGEARRLTLIALRRSRAELVDGFSSTADGRDTLLNLIDQVQSYATHARGAAEIANTALMRLFSAAQCIERAHPGSKAGGEQ